MIKKITLTLSLALAFLTGRAAYTPVSVTGFNADVIANGSGIASGSISSSIPSGFDGAGYTFVAQDYSYDGSTPDYYLPTGGALTSILTPGLTYQLADYSSNNALRLVNTGNAGTLVFTTPTAAGRLYLLGTSGSGDAECTATVYFSDGTSQSFTSLDYPDWYSDGGAINGIGRASTTDGHTEGDDMSPSLFERNLDIDPANYSKLIDSVNISKTSGSGIIGIFALSSEDVCSGVPTPGSVVAMPASGCGAFSTTLSLSGSGSVGTVYQWESSTDGTSWSPVDGATDATYPTTIFSSQYFRCIVSCSVSTDTVITDSIYTAIVTPVAAVATVPYFEGFENWMGSCYSYDRPDSNWLTRPASGDASWRRDDQGSDAGWDFADDGSYSPASTEGSHSARFHTDEVDAFGSNTGHMDLYVDLSAAGSKLLSFDYNNASGPDYLRVQISEDTGHTFVTLDSIVATSGWAPEYVTLTSTSPYAIIRFVATVPDYDGSDIGLDSVSITMMTPCTGTPVAGAVSASQTEYCSEYTSMLSLVYDPTISLSYQWQSSVDSLSWTNVDGATSTTYYADVTSTIYYRAYVVCSATGNADTTAGVKLTLDAPTLTIATLPFSESFENWVAGCTSYDRPSTSWLTNPHTGNSSWRRDDQGDDGLWDFPTDGAYTPVSTVGSHSARFHADGDLFDDIPGNMDLYVDLSAAGSKTLSFDYINPDGFFFGAADVEVMLSEDTGHTFTSIGSYFGTAGWSSQTVTLTSTAPEAIIRFQASGIFVFNDVGLDNVQIGVNTTCSGTPTTGPVTVSQYTGCSEFTSTLSIPVVPSISGLTYQWQSSADSVAWTDIESATDASYTADVTANTYYRLKVTCTSSSTTDSSAGILLSMVTPTYVNATVPYFESFESWIGTCFNYDRPSINWTTTPASGNNSWRRDDQGADASWDFPGDYMYDPASTDGAHSARFHSGEYPNDLQGSMDLHIDMSAVGSKLIHFDYNNIDGMDNLTVQLSEDSGHTFTTIANFAPTGSFDWVPENIMVTSTSASAVIRFTSITDNESSDVGIDSLSITVLPSCSGAPVAGTFTASQTSSCAEYTSTLSVDSPIYATGIVYQWQSSPDSLTWTDMPSATGTIVNVLVNTTKYYRVKVSCTASGLTDSTAGTELTYSGGGVLAATLPYTQSFENWIAGCASHDRPDTSWLTSPTTGNNAWRRNDQGSDADWSFTSGGAYSPVSSDGAHSARFHSEEADIFDGETYGTMDLYVDLSPAGSKNISFDYTNEDGTDNVQVMLSTDGGVTFSTLGTYNTTSGWETEVITTSSTASNAILRFYATSDYGGTDIGIDNLHIGVITPCSGTPDPGAITASMTNSCSEYNPALSITPDPSISGITYQWQSSPDSATWTSVDTATGTTYVPDVTATMYVRLIATCTATGSTDTTAGTELVLNTPVASFATLPFFEGFESWIAGCYNYDRPGVNWLINPTTGNNSWRRDDQGDDASWDDTEDGMYDPASTEGAHSARFHTYEADPFGSSGTGGMDLYVDLSDPGTKTINFDYINSNDDEGTDTLQVWLSADGGATFALLAAYGSTSPDWLSETLTTTAVSSTAILRFKAISDYGGTDIGIDSLSITAIPVCDTAVLFTATDVTGTSATLSWDSVAGSSYQYVVNTTPGAPAAAGTAVTDTFVDVSGLTGGTTYYAHLRTICAGGDSSVWITISFTTPAACGTITGLSITSITSSSVTFSWSSTATAVGYEYVIDNNESSPSGGGTATTATSATDTGLTCNTHYYIHIRTDCTADTSGWLTQNFTTSPCLGVVNVNNENFSLDAYPNPAKDVVVLQVNGTPAGKATVRLTDVTGKTLQVVNVTNVKTELDMSHVAPGTYFINYVDEVHNNAIKITKQ